MVVQIKMSRRQLLPLSRQLLSFHAAYRGAHVVSPSDAENYAEKFQNAVEEAMKYNRTNENIDLVVGTKEVAATVNEGEGDCMDAFTDSPLLVLVRCNTENEYVAYAQYSVYKHGDQKYLLISITCTRRCARKLSLSRWLRLVGLIFAQEQNMNIVSFVNEMSKPLLEKLGFTFSQDTNAIGHWLDTDWLRKYGKFMRSSAIEFNAVLEHSCIPNAIHIAAAQLIKKEDAIKQFDCNKTCKR